MKPTILRAGGVAGVALAAGLVAFAGRGAPALGQINVPTMRVQSQVVPNAIRTALRLARGAALRIKEGQAIAVQAVVLVPATRLMVTGLGDGSARVWDLQLGREIGRIDAQAGGLGAIAVSGDGAFLATGGRDGVARLWRLPGGEALARFEAHQGPVTAVALDETGKLLVTAGADGVVRLWDTAAQAERGRLTGHAGAISSLALSADGTVLVTGGADRTVRLWDLALGVELARLEGHAAAVTTVALSADGGVLASADEAGTIKVWDPVARVETRSFANGAGVLSLALSDNARFVGTGGSDSVVRLFDISTGEQTRSFRGHTGPVRFVGFEATNQFLHTASEDGTSRVWDLPTGDELAQVISTVSGWIVAEEDGQYDGSDGGINAVEWVTSEGPFDLDQLFEQRYEPGVLAKLLEGTAAAGAGVEPIAEGFPVPPKVRIYANGNRDTGGRPGVDLTVEAKDDGGGGVAEIRLYHNGKKISANTSGVTLMDETRRKGLRSIRLVVPLIAGENRFQAIALNEGRVESRPVTVTVSQTGSNRVGVLHLVTIGINRYRNPALNLNYGVPDAKGLTKFFTTVGTSAFREVRVYELYDDLATRQGVLDYLRIVRDSQPEDVIMVFVATHGEAIGNQWFLVPFDVARPDRKDELLAKAVSSSQIQEQVAGIGARKILVMIDSCKSGTALASFRGFDEMKALRFLARLAGIHVIASADNEQLATELANLGHGVFTYAALEGLRGGADVAPKDGMVTVVELIDFIKARVRELAQQYNSVRQEPISLDYGENFALARAAGAAGG